jgi:phosphatidylglycerol---prolipoprotein diacylglyceryl transferase
MYPTLVKIGNFELTSFGVMMAAAFFVAGWILSREFRRRSIPDDYAWSVVVYAAIGGILGAKIYYAILYRSWDALFSRAGLVWYGGLIGGLLAVTWYLKNQRINWFVAADAVAPALALGYGVGRVGCFLVGDDYGRPTDSWVGIAFPEGLPPTTAYYLREFGADVDPTLPGDTLLKVHPTQLYEVGGALLIYFVLTWLVRRRPASGMVFGVFLVLFGIERFLVEILRAKDDRFIGMFTVAQLISVVLVVAGLILATKRRASAEA